MDHGGHDAVGIDLEVDHLIPEVHGGDPHNRLAVGGSDNLVALVLFHWSSLLSLDGYIIAGIAGSVNSFFKKNFLFFFKKRLTNCFRYAII